MGTVWLIALIFTAADLKLDATVRNEDRAGVLATGPTTPSVRAADFELNPRLLLRLATPQTLTTCSYGPRLFYRVPDPLAKGPLVLHQGDLELIARLSPVWTLSSKAYLYAGAVDYSRALLVFDARTQTPASLPDTGTIRYLSSGAVVALARTLSEQQRVSSSLQVSTNRPLPGTSSAGFPAQNRAELAGQYVWGLGLRDELQGTLSLSETEYRPGPAYASFSPLAGWRRVLDHHQELTLHLGALMAATNGYATGSESGSPATVPRGLRFLPIVDGTYSYQAGPVGRAILRGEVSAGVTGYFEPVAAVVEPRGFLTLKGELAPSTATQLRLTGAVYAPLNRAHSAQTAAFADPFPTVGYADAAWHQVWSNQVDSELGVRASTRATPLTASRLTTNQPELLGYVAVTVAAELVE